jgi:hypothetical protein
VSIFDSFFFTGTHHRLTSVKLPDVSLFILLYFFRCQFYFSDSPLFFVSFSLFLLCISVEDEPLFLPLKETKEKKHTSKKKKERSKTRQECTRVLGGLASFVVCTNRFDCFCGRPRCVFLSLPVTWPFTVLGASLAVFFLRGAAVYQTVDATAENKKKGQL